MEGKKENCKRCKYAPTSYEEYCNSKCGADRSICPDAFEDRAVYCKENIRNSTKQSPDEESALQGGNYYCHPPYQYRNNEKDTKPEPKKRSDPLTVSMSDVFKKLKIA